MVGAANPSDFGLVAMGRALSLYTPLAGHTFSGDGPDILEVVGIVIRFEATKDF